MAGLATLLPVNSPVETFDVGTMKMDESKERLPQGFIGVVERCMARDERGRRHDLVVKHKGCSPSGTADDMQCCLMFAREGYFYKRCMPVLASIARQTSPGSLDFVMDVFPRVYYTNYDVAENNSVLIMDDLAAAGFAPGDCDTGFSAAELKLVLSALAKYHALTHVYITRLQPDWTEEQEALLKRSWYTNCLGEIKPMYHEGLKQLELKYGVEHAAALDVFRSAFKKHFIDAQCYHEDDAHLPTVLSHGDLMCQNVMISGSRVKIIDYQMVRVGSVGEDISSLLITAGWPSDQGNLDAFIRHYTVELRRCLANLCSDDEALNIEEDCVKRDVLRYTDQILASILTTFNWDSGKPFQHRLLDIAECWKVNSE